MSDGTGDKRGSEIDQMCWNITVSAISAITTWAYASLAAPEKFAEGRLVREVFVTFTLTQLTDIVLVELKLIAL